MVVYAVRPLPFKIIHSTNQHSIYNLLCTVFCNMLKKRVKFKTNGSNEIQIGYLVKDSGYKNKLKVVSADKKSGYCISLLDMIERF